MSENNNPKQTRGVTLREPKDVHRVCQRIVSKAFQQGEELQYSGRISQLMGCWMKAWVKNNARRFRQARPQDAKHYNKRAYDGSHTQSGEC